MLSSSFGSFNLNKEEEEEDEIFMERDNTNKQPNINNKNCEAFSHFNKYYNSVTDSSSELSSSLEFAFDYQAHNKSYLRKSCPDFKILFPLELMNKNKKYKTINCNHVVKRLISLNQKSEKNLVKEKKLFTFNSLEKLDLYNNTSIKYIKEKKLVKPKKKTLEIEDRLDEVWFPLEKLDNEEFFIKSEITKDFEKNYFVESYNPVSSQTQSKIIDQTLSQITKSNTNLKSSSSFSSSSFSTSSFFFHVSHSYTNVCTSLSVPICFSSKTIPSSSSPTYLISSSNFNPKNPNFFSSFSLSLSSSSTSIRPPLSSPSSPLPSSLLPSFSPPSSTLLSFSSSLTSPVSFFSSSSSFLSLEYFPKSSTRPKDLTNITLSSNDIKLMNMKNNKNRVTLIRDQGNSNNTSSFEVLGTPRDLRVGVGKEIDVYCLVHCFQDYSLKWSINNKDVREFEDKRKMKNLITMNKIKFNILRTNSSTSQQNKKGTKYQNNQNNYYDVINNGICQKNNFNDNNNFLYKHILQIENVTKELEGILQLEVSTGYQKKNFNSKIFYF